MFYGEENVVDVYVENCVVCFVGLFGDWSGWFKNFCVVEGDVEMVEGCECVFDECDVIGFVCDVGVYEECSVIGGFDFDNDCVVFGVMMVGDDYVCIFVG